MSKDKHPFGHGVPNFGSSGPDRLEETLRAQAAGTASKVFRAGLKQSFLGGETSEQEDAPDSVSKRLVETLDSRSAPAPAPEFRSKMRGLFLEQGVELSAASERLSGSEPSAIPQEAPNPEPSATPEDESSPEPVREIRSAGSAKQKPGKLLSFWAPLAAVAALLLAVLGPKFFGSDSQDVVPNAVAWSLPDDVSDVEWTIDGLTVDATDSAEQIAERLSAAHSVAAVDGGKLRLSYGRLFLVQLSEGSELDLSNFQDPESSTDFHLAMGGDSGGFYFQTGPEFKEAGCELTFQTPEAEIAVVGTVFAVDRYALGSAMEGTCVCCAEGTVQVNAVHKRKTSTLAGKSCFVVPGGADLIHSDVAHDHMLPMKDLLAAEPPSLWLD